MSRLRRLPGRRLPVPVPCRHGNVPVARLSTRLRGDRVVENQYSTGLPLGESRTGGLQLFLGKVPSKCHGTIFVRRGRWSWCLAGPPRPEERNDGVVHHKERDVQVISLTRLRVVSHSLGPRYPRYLKVGTEESEEKRQSPPEFLLKTLPSLLD